MRSAIVGVLMQDLDRRLAALAVGGAHQALRDDRAQVDREVHQELVAPLLGEEIDDAVDRLVRVVRVQRPQAEVARLGERDRVLHRLGVADLADQDHVGRLAQRVLERVMPRVRVDADFAVRDQRLLRLVHVLDRVLDRDDVAVGRAVAVIDHRRERRRFARAGAADHQHQPALGHDDFLEDLGKAELLEVRDLGGDRADHHADVLLLDEDVDAEAREARDGDREIALEVLRELLALALVHHRVRELARDLARELLAASAAACAVRLHASAESRPR